MISPSKFTNPSRVATGQLPNLLIIGAQKSGTTSLHTYLSYHPEIFMSKRKELEFFAGDNQHQDVDWYRSHFRTDKAVRGESSMIYTQCTLNPSVPGKIHNLIPDAKLIYILRDPIDRILSQYSHFVADDREGMPFDQAVFDDRRHGYIVRSLYYTQLCFYLQYFSKEQILIFSTESMEANKRETLSKVFRFLGVDDTFYTPLFERRLNVTARKRVKNKLGKSISKLPIMQKFYDLSPKLGIPFSPRQHWPWPLSSPVTKPVLTPEQRRRLIAEILPDIEKLRELTGQAFSEWSI